MRVRSNQNVKIQNVKVNVKIALFLTPAELADGLGMKSFLFILSPKILVPPRCFVWMTTSATNFQRKKNTRKVIKIS